MKKIITLLSIAVFSILFAKISFANSHQLPTEPNKPAYAKTIPPDKLKKDLDFLFKTIEEVHPNMYAYTPKEEFIPLRDELYHQIKRPMTRLEFYKITAVFRSLITEYFGYRSQSSLVLGYPKGMRLKSAAVAPL